MSRAGGELVYAIGDIHGCYAPLKELLAQVVCDCAERARGRRPILVFLGDYIDRGPQSDAVLEAMVWLKRRSDAELHLLKGNHEQALLRFLDEPEGAAGWLRFGGEETLVSYGVMPPSLEEGLAGLVRARDDLLQRMPAAHLKLLQSLELMVEVGDYAFVHAGVRPGAGLAAQTEDDLLWIRGGFLDHEGPHEKVIVHGHTWLGDQPQLYGHRIGVDTGCYATGVLTAVRIEDDGVAVLQAGAKAQAVAA